MFITHMKQLFKYRKKNVYLWQQLWNIICSSWKQEFHISFSCESADRLRDDSLITSNSTNSMRVVLQNIPEDGSFCSIVSRGQTSCDAVESDPGPVTPAGRSPPRRNGTICDSAAQYSLAIIPQMEFLDCDVEFSLTFRLMSQCVRHRWSV